MGSFPETYPAGRAAKVSDKNSWDTSIERCFFSLLLLLFLPMPNVAYRS